MHHLTLEVRPMLSDDSPIGRVGDNGSGWEPGWTQEVVPMRVGQYDAPHRCTSSRDKGLDCIELGRRNAGIYEVRFIVGDEKAGIRREGGALCDPAGRSEISKGHGKR